MQRSIFFSLIMCLCGCDTADEQTESRVDSGPHDGGSELLDVDIPVVDAAADGGGFVPAAPTLYRLTSAQYTQIIHDVFGADLVIPPPEVDTPLHGFISIGTSEMTISPVAAERYEAVADSVSIEVFGDLERARALVGCDAEDADCRLRALTTLGRRLWRRPLADVELVVLMDVIEVVRPHVPHGMRALGAAVSTMLQSPHFLFRVQIGEPHPDREGLRRYTDWEMAERVSFLLWNTGPDEALLDAAAAGELTTEGGLSAQVERLSTHPRAQAAVAGFFSEYLSLQRLDMLQKDRRAFPLMSDTLGASMRAEIEAVLARLVFEDDTDLRALLTTRQTYVDGALAALYQLPGVAETAWAEHPDHGARAGLLTTAGFLALNAHNTVTSPTFRGKYIQNKLLCFDVPPPPPGVSTTLEEPQDGPQTMRERLARHNADPQCGGCHQFMDPLGLALENFDALGVWRTTDNGLPIDASGRLGEREFVGARALGELLAEGTVFSACVARQFYRHALGHLETPGEEAAVRALAVTFIDEVEHRFLPLVDALVMSDAFRLVGEVE